MLLPRGCARLALTDQATFFKAGFLRGWMTDVLHIMINLYNIVKNGRVYLENLQGYLICDLQPWQ
jgi:hypothetical protein